MSAGRVVFWSLIVLGLAVTLAVLATRGRR